MRLLRLLQASGVPLNPGACRWGASALAPTGTGAPAADDTSAPSVKVKTLGTTISPEITAPAPVVTTKAALSTRHRWEWLTAAFEPRRLKASIETFPIKRELEPSPFEFEICFDERERIVGKGAHSPFLVTKEGTTRGLEGKDVCV